MRGILCWLTAAVLLALPLETPLAADADEPDVVVVQHILIGFKRSVTGKRLARTKAEARQLAQQLLERARAGEDFDELVEQYTDDQYPGVHKLTNRGAPRRGDARTRDEMVPRFGDVAFALEVGEVGLAHYHGGNSPFGWHVIKRLE